MMNNFFLRCGCSRRHVILAFLVLTVTVARYMPWLGRMYNVYIYPVIGYTLSSVSQYVPFAMGDVFIACSVVALTVYPVCRICNSPNKVKRVFAQLAECLLWIYVWFYVAWGLNYAQPNIFQRMHMHTVEVNKQSFLRFANAYADSLNATYTVHGICYKDSVQAWIQKGYGMLTRYSVNMGINRPFCRHVPAKTMAFSSLSSMAGVWGSMVPFFGEFTLNADLQPHEYPSTCAHELSHFYGVANEGEANFYSYLVCTSSPCQYIRFSGYYHILSYVLADARQLLGETQYEQYLQRLRPEVLRLAQHDRIYWLTRRCKVVDDVQSYVYNLYLHGNRVENGLYSYSGVLYIIMAWYERCKTISSIQVHK